MKTIRDLVLILTGLVVSVKFGFDAKWYVKRLFWPQANTITLGSNISSTVVAHEAKRWSSQPPEVLPPSDHPPLQIVVGATYYSVHYTTHEWLLMNQCSTVTFHDKREIWMSRGDSDPRQELMHELFHVAKHEGAERWTFAGEERNTPETQDHDFIRPAAPELLLILRRNPELVTWLMNSAHNDSAE